MRRLDMHVFKENIRIVFIQYGVNERVQVSLPDASKECITNLLKTFIYL